MDIDADEICGLSGNEDGSEQDSEDESKANEESPGAVAFCCLQSSSSDSTIFFAVPETAVVVRKSVAETARPFLDRGVAKPKLYRDLWKYKTLLGFDCSLTITRLWLAK